MLAHRQASTLMRLRRMGASFPTRLSFSRLILRNLTAAHAQPRQHCWRLDDNGYGCAVYVVRLQNRDYSLVAFSQALADEHRTDRVIADAWDTTYALYDGIPNEEALAWLQDNVPKQEAGRYDARVLVLSRANKSVRLFGYVVECLAAGRQPSAEKICPIGYLMRTTAVYGNGKFGIADRSVCARRDILAQPFQAELLTVWLIRGFTHDLVEHIAKRQGGDKAVALAAPLKRYLGIGNSTGLGMAPFLVMHPLLIHRWMAVREAALARVCAVTRATPAVVDRLQALSTQATRHLAEWAIADERFIARLEVLRHEWREVCARLADAALFEQVLPWQGLLTAVGTMSAECQELLAAMLLEAYPDEVDDLAADMASDEIPRLQPDMRLGELRDLLTKHASWALSVDFSDKRQTHRFWYVSEEKLEPRLGARWEEKGAELELPLDIARQFQALFEALQDQDEAQMVAVFLLFAPEHREAVRRLQALAICPYAEIQDNLIGEDCLPIDMLRWKLSFLGAAKFDPRSDLWTRVVFFQGAPLFDEITEAADDWWLAAMNGDALLG